VVLSDDLYKAVYGTPANVGATFSLTATQGSMITLPNGAVVEKAFRGIAESQAERFSQVVRNGLLTGETTPAIAKRLIGTLERSNERLMFGDIGPLTQGQLRAVGRSVRETIAAGGELTAMADNQIVALVRTSINQVANAAAMQTYEANPDITSKYRYVATLDSRTSAICRALDGKEFPYGQGPTPPQHFNCRSTIVAVIDNNLLGPSKVAKRASADGPVPADTTYGKWLHDQPASVQAKVLGPSKVPYFNRLANKYGPEKAITKLVAEDGSELTLEQLQKRYGPAKP
jgi:SPP1 gp7 family putative phage head morphogenesis protein